jgi:hypothetical protein
MKSECNKCSKEISFILGTETSSFPLIDGGTRLRLQGGYGMYFDDYDSGDYVLDLCFDCSSEMMQYVNSSIKYKRQIFCHEKNTKRQVKKFFRKKINS